MPQLIAMTSGSGLSLNFRCPYQAKVMKTFEQNSIRIGKTDDGIVMGMAELSDMARGRRRLLTANIRVKREVARAFSSEVGTGSREENASEQKPKAFHRFCAV
jgi:hypothetical protein